MLTSKDLLYLALLLASPDGMITTSFRRYGVVSFFSLDPHRRLDNLLAKGLIFELPDHEKQCPRYFISPAGALAHFHSTLN